MKKVLPKVFAVTTVFAKIGFFAISLFALASCGEDSGLGSSVDTEPPSLTITYPPSSAVVNGSFVFSGTATDDKQIASVSISVADSLGKEVYNVETIPERDGSWSVELNKYDSSNPAYYNGWQFADGTYKISAIAYDNAGRKSGLIPHTLSVDNTPPVLVLTKPTSVGSDDAQTYGQAVLLQGSVSEMSNGGKFNLTVDFYNENGKYLLSSTFENIIDMSSANPLTIAQYYPESARPSSESDANWEKWNNYKTIYGIDYIKAYEEYRDGKSSQKPDDKTFYFTVTANDTALNYTNKKSQEGTGSGNATSVYYRGTPEMLKLIEGKSIQNFSVLSLQNYLNKTDSTYADNADLKKILDEAASVSAKLEDSSSRTLLDSSKDISDSIKNTDTKDGSVYLNFQVNPLNNPTYSINGYLVDESKVSENEYSSGTEEGVSAGFHRYFMDSNLTVSVSPGRDETQLKPATVSFFMNNTDPASTDDQILVWTWNKETAIAYAMKKNSVGREAATAAIEALTAASTEYRYTPTRSEAILSSMSIDTTLGEEDGLVSGKTYILSAEGEDNDGNALVPVKTAGYGIWAAMNAEPPEVSFGDTDSTTNTNLAQDSVINSISRESPLHFTGNALSAVALNENDGLTYAVTLTDSSDSKRTVTIEGTAAFSTEDTRNPFNYAWNFDFPAATLSEEKFAEIQEIYANEGRYKLEIFVWGKSVGGKSKESRSLIVDTKKPVVRNLSVTNSYAKNGVTYISGKSDFKISGSSSDNYELASTVWKVSGTDKDGKLIKIEGGIEKSENWEVTVTSEQLKDFVSVDEISDITVSAYGTDIAGNVGEEAVLSIEIDATAPVLKSDKIGGTAYSGNGSWQKSTTIGVEGEITENQSGVKAVYYQIEPSDSASDFVRMTSENAANVQHGGVIYTVSGDSSDSFTQTLEFKTGTSTLRYAIADNLGNVSEVYERTIKTDSSSPVVSELESGNPERTSFSTAQFGNSASKFSFAYYISDSESGVNADSISVKVNDKTVSASDDTYGTLRADYIEEKSAYLVKVTLKDSEFNENDLYTVTSNVSDVAGNSAQNQVGIFSIDRTPPLVKIRQESGSNLFVREGKTVSATVSDVGGISEITWAVFEKGENADYDSNPNPVETGTAEAGTSADITVHFDKKAEDDTTYIFESDKEYVICVKAKDEAGNEGAYSASSAYIVDRDGPIFDDEHDGLKGSDWFNSTTIVVSGKWNDGSKGSGATTLYYQLNGENALTQENYEEVGKPVAIDSKGNFSVNIADFKSSDANKLLYVAVDLVGNVSEVKEHVIKVDTSKPIFRDATVDLQGNYPELTVETQEAIKDDEKTFKVAVCDTGSGITNSESQKKFSATVAGLSENPALERPIWISYEPDETPASGYQSSGVVTVTIKKNLINALQEGVANEVLLTAEDNAANFTTTTIGYIKTDVSAPRVTVQLESGKNLYVNGQKTVNATITDQGTIKKIEWAVFQKREDRKYDTDGITPVKSGELTGNAITNSPSVTVDFNEKVDENYLFKDSEEYVICVKADDTAGNSGVYELKTGDNGNLYGGGISNVYRVDRTGPDLSEDKISDAGYDSSKWLNANVLTVNGTWTDSYGAGSSVTGSGASALYYVLTQTEISEISASAIAGSALRKTVAIDDNGTYTTNISGFKTGNNYLYYVASDYAGNLSAVKSHTIKIDTKAPDAVSDVTVNESAVDSANSFYTNKTKALTNPVDAMSISFTVADETGGSGIDTNRVYVLPYKKVSNEENDNTEIAGNKADLSSGTNGTFTFSISSSKIENSGSVYARIYDKAGNASDVNLFAFVVDTTSPQIQNYTVADEKPGFAAYKKTKDGDENHFYVHSGNSHTFTLSGVATDNLGIEKVELTLKDSAGAVLSGYPKTSSDVSNWKFEEESLSGVASALIEVTDKAGNTVEQTIAFTQDVTSPVAKHEYDAKKKDLYFRVGEFDNDLDEIKKLVTGATTLDNNLDKDVGGKYSAGTWGTASTITIRGYWTEEGSGVKTIYYKIFNDVPTAEQITEFNTKYAQTGESDGNFAPCAEVTKRVVYTKSLNDDGSTNEQGTAEIPYSFKTAIPGFNSEKNYLLLVAVDNVGNAAIDTLGADKADGVTTDVTSENWNSGLAAFSLNVDTVAPSLTSSTSGSQYTNKITPIKVSFGDTDEAKGIVTDASSGVKSVVLSIEDVADSSVTVESSELVEDSTDKTKKYWKATIPTDILSKLSSGTYNVNATVKDNAGNKADSTIFTLQVDTDAPTVSMVTPTYNATTASAVNGKISVKGTSEYTGAAPSKFALYYTTTEPKSTATNESGTPLSALTPITLDGTTSSATEITDLSKITSWEIKNFDSYAVFGDDTTSAAKDIYIVPVVYDVAGNCNIYREEVTETTNGETVTQTVTRSYSYTEGTNFFKYSVDKNSDRPIITLGNCDVSGTALKSTSKAYGTIEDDDGLTGLHLFYIAKGNSVPSAFPTVENGSVTLNGWKECPLTSGSWDIDSGVEGHFSYYLYAIDAEGGKFWSTAESALSQMYVYNGVNDKSEKKDEKVGLSFSADLNPPEIESVEIAHKSLPADFVAQGNETGWSAVTETFGPTDKSLYLKVVVSEFIGLKEKDNLTESDTTLLARLSIPTVTIGGTNVTPNLKSVASETKSKTVGDKTDTTYYTFLFDAIDLSTLNLTGAKTAKVVVTDKSGFTGQGTIGINYDRTAPSIKIISPTAAISDAVISATSVKGTAFDDYSSIQKLEYVIPANGQSYTTDSDNWITIGSSTGTWEIEFDSGSTESPSSLLYYAANHDDYVGVEEVSEGLGIYAIPFYFRTTDSVGNVEVHKTYSEKSGESSVSKPFIVYANPDGGKPSAWINAPETGITTSGTVTIYGGAMDNISVKTVCVQIDANGDGVINDDDYTYLMATNEGETQPNYEVFGLEAGSLVESTVKDGEKQNDWYIKASGTNSWKVILNTNKIPSYEVSAGGSGTTVSGITLENGKKYLLVRVRAIDADDNTRKYTNPNVVKIDNVAPYFKNLKLVQYGKNATASVSKTPVTEREYVSGMYISNITAEKNGTWYLYAEVESHSDIKSITADTQASETATVIPLSDTTTFVSNTEKVYATGSGTSYKLLIPLNTTESGVIYSMLKADNVSDGAPTGEQTIKINIDSTAPSLYTTGGSETLDATSTNDGQGTLRIKSQNKILGTNSESNAVIENSDGYFSLGDTVKEAGSGLAWLAFYFENDIKGMVYDPMIKVSDSTYGGTTFAASSENLSSGSVYINSDNLAALYLTDVTRGSDTTFSLTAANDHVRIGGLVKIGGTYHTISGVDERTVTFTPAVSTSFTTVELIYAQVVDHAVTENIVVDYDDNDIGTERIESDDGDGMCENLTQQGSYYNWSAMVDSNNIPDGTTYIRLVAMDNAGNLSHGKIASMVANNRPRLTKVFIGTDLNGNGKYDFDADDGDAPVVSTSNKTRTKSGTSFGEFNYYTAYNTRSGAAQSKVTLDSSAFKVISGLCIVPEFTGGNGSLKYTLTNGSDLNPYAGGELKEMVPRNSSTASDATMEKKGESDTNYYINNVGKLSLFGNTAITDGDNKNAVAYGISDSESGNNYKDFGGIVIADGNAVISGSDGATNNVKVTFFDNTDSTDGAAHADGQWATLVIPVTIKSSDTTVPQPKIKPFHWADSTDNSLYVKKDSNNVYQAASATEKNGVIAGHIELEGALPTGSNLTADLPKVSGIIKVEGTIFDDVRLEAISMSIFGGANTKVASYTSGAWGTATSLPTGLVSFTAVDEDMSQKGHTVKYTAVIDTEKLSVSGYPVGKAQWITVGASDWKHNYVTSNASVTGGSAPFTVGDGTSTAVTPAQTKSATNTNCYQMDVVPYVTEIVTHLSAFSGTAHSVYARTAHGHYPCYEGETIEFKGYNLGSGKAKVVIQGMTAGGDALSEANKITLTATSTGKTGAVSGAISLSVNGIPAMNNINTNNACGSYTTEDTGRAYTDDNYAHCYNRQPNGVNNNTLTDDLELDVWQFKNAAKPVNGGAERVTMKIRPTDGTPGFSYANSVLYFSMPGYNADHTNDTAWRSENGTINGTYASQIPFGMNYGGFSHNSFTFDNQGYSYGAAMCTDTNNASQSAFFQFFSKETPLPYNSYDQNMNYANEANASRLDSSTMNVGTDNSQNWQCNINRIQSISMETSNLNGTAAATDEAPVYVFMAYYDAIVKQVRFRWGTVGGYSDSIDGKSNNNNQDTFSTRKNNAYGLDDIHDSKYTGRAEDGKNAGGCRPSYLADSFVKYSNTNNGGIPIQVIAASGMAYSGIHNSIYNKMEYTAGQYVSLSILGKDTASPTACVFWYDGSKLMMAYNSSPTTSNSWTYKTVDTDGGLHVKSAVDSDGGIHLAYYTSNGGNLKYAYLSGVTADPQIATVDANGAVGTKCTIDVAKVGGNQVPYITYQMIGGVYTYNAKIAYRTNFTSTTVPNGADSKDMFTGDWEVSVIPTESSRLLNDDTINVGLWRDSNGAAQAFTSNAYWKESDKWFNAATSATLGTLTNGEDGATGVSNNTMNVGNPSLIYGNNTANPIVGYGIESGAIEMAQKK
ncbi:Ig-like domain-containing protein [uncultured Treponema sp.]|uniref:Ig-like domain-containing protein n=1 Tax=uncultured Treponema sp. TaxID=162155 RepID=UPI0025EB43D2|nr:Ig-like domain-containing protein [uncultured Treponema sp.]